MADEPLLRPEEVASVLSREACEESAAKPGSAVYSLRRPVLIAPDEEPAAREHLERYARGLEQILQHELDAQVRFRIQGFQQEQAGAAVEMLPKPAWILTFLRQEGGGLALALDPTCALSLVELALGGAGNMAACGREPTPLESRVLGNLCASVTEPLGARCGTKLVRGTLEIGRLHGRLAMPGETVGVGLLKIQIAEKERSGLLLATPNLLKQAPGPRPRSSGLRLGPLAARLALVPVEVRPVLKAGFAALSDLMELRPGALLNLEPPESAPLDLRVAGRRLFSGQVIRTAGAPAFRVSRRRGRPVAGPGLQETEREGKGKR